MLSVAYQPVGHNPVKTMASPQPSKGISIGCISSGGSNIAGAAKRGRFGGGDAWWGLGRLCLHHIVEGTSQRRNLKQNVCIRVKSLHRSWDPFCKPSKSTPNQATAKAFAKIHHLSIAPSALQQCLVFASAPRRPFPPLSTTCIDVQYTCPHHTLKAYLWHERDFARR